MIVEEATLFFDINITMNNLKYYQIFLFFFLLTVTFFLYSPMLNAKFAPTDDHIMLKHRGKYVPDISLSLIVDVFKIPNRGLYHPLVTLSYSLEKSIFGLVPEFFHLDNILLHILNILLVFIIFNKLSNSFWLSFIISILFAIHPTRTEVVCWISARKDLLYSCFYLLSILSYIKTYERKKFFFPIIISIFFYLMACLSKSMAITLPFAIFLIDLYTDHLDKRRLKAYIFFIITSLVFIVATIKIHYFTNYPFTQENDIPFLFNDFNIAINFINSHFNILFYLEKLFLPIKLYLKYPLFYDKYSTMPPAYILYSPCILYMLFYFSYLSLKRTKNFFYGFVFFLISILPVSGLFPIGGFLVADRYTYLTYLGLFFVVAKSIAYLFGKSRKYIKAAIILIFFVIFVTLCYLSHIRVIDWKTNHYGAPITMKYYNFGIKK